MILPTGIATDATTQYFFKDLVTSRVLMSILGFYDRGKLFEGADVHSFCLMVVGGQEWTSDTAELAFYAHNVEDLKRDGVRFTLTPDEITLLNPNTGTCPVFRSRRDAEITLAIYRRHPVLIKKDAPDGNPWGVSFMQGLFNITSDSGMFHTRDELESQGWRLKGNVFRHEGKTMLPLCEAKMIHLYDHRWATYETSGDVRDVSEAEHEDCEFVVLPRYWVDKREIDDRLADRWEREWLLSYRRICRSTDIRTSIPCLMPRTATSDGSPNAVSANPSLHLLGAVWTSIPFDYCVRQRVGGTHLDYFNLFQAPVPSPDYFSTSCLWAPNFSLQTWIEDRLKELVFTSKDMSPFARDLGDNGAPFVWSSERRALLSAELDAAWFHIYGINREDAEYILSTFPVAIRRDPYLLERVLAAYDQIADAVESGMPFESTLYPPPSCGPRHRLNL